MSDVVSQSPLVIWGAGAIGGVVGAYLIRAGHPVLFVDIDADHVAAINAGGIRIEGPIETFHVGATAVTPDMLNGTFERILLCVKAHHTEGATHQIVPHLSANGYVASYQNGLNELVIAGIIGAERTIGAFVNFGADYLSPGVIHFGGRGAVVLGELDGATTDRVLALHALMLVFEPNAIVSPDIMGYLWGKLGYGAQLFATALTNESICACLGAEAAQPLLTAIAMEATEVTLRLGIKLRAFNGYDPEAFRPGASEALRAASYAAMVAHNAKSAKTHSGIWRDLAVRKRKTEVDAQLGPIITEGRKHGVPTPTTEGLIAMIHEIEDGMRPLAWENLADLWHRVRPA
jgi:2-dehydropantoate 2-reductase